MTSPAAPAGDLLSTAPRRLTTAVLGGITALRLIQVAAWPLAVITGGHAGLRSLALSVLMYAVATLATCGTLALIWIRRSIPMVASVLDSVTGFATLVAGGLVTKAAHGTDFHHPTLAIAIGGAVTVAVARPFKPAIVTIGTFGIAYLVGIHATLALGSTAVTSTMSNVLMLVAVPVGVGVAVRYLLTVATRTTAAENALAASARQIAAQQGREIERARQYRILHDTVLSTLSALSRGSLDPREPPVRQRLSADADYLRGLIATTGSAAGMRLVGELAAVGREQAQVGLRVHPHIADVPDDLPEDVVRGVVQAIREALNNVVKHSGTLQAWVTIVGTTDQTPLLHSDGRTAQLRVTITDRGNGFDPAITPQGLGMSQSITARINEFGGSSMIDSEPGQGTTVEMTWPR